MCISLLLPAMTQPPLRFDRTGSSPITHTRTGICTYASNPACCMRSSLSGYSCTLRASQMSWLLHAAPATWNLTQQERVAIRGLVAARSQRSIDPEGCADSRHTCLYMESVKSCCMQPRPSSSPA